MKMYRLIVIALIMISFVACKKDIKKEIPKASETIESTIIPSISGDELQSLGNNIQLVDVRTPEEFELGYIKNAININVKGTDFLESTVLLDKSKPVYVYCMAGIRSAKAANILKEAGFKEVYNYVGGYGEWIKNGNVISID